MKKTFFKRSMASVLSTCLVLTQGVFAAPAVTTLTANAADTNVTIKSFTDIAPDAEKSEWGLNFNTLFKQNAPEIGGTAEVDASVAQNLLNGYTGFFRNGAYDELATAIAGNIQTGVLTRTATDTYEVNFELAESGALIADEANARLAKQVEKTLGADAVSYMTPLDFSGFSVKGSVTVNLDLSDLNDDNKISATYLFTDEKGTSYALFGDGTGEDLYDYIDSKYDEAAAIIKNAITDQTPAELKEVLETKLANGKKTIDGYKQEVTNKYNWIKGMSTTRNGSDVNDALDGLYALYGDSKYYPQALKSLDVLAASSTWAARYANAASNANTFLAKYGAVYSIGYGDLMSYFGTLTNVNVVIGGGNATMKADMPEDQMDELIAYYDAQGLEVVSSVKHVELNMDLVSGAAAGGALNITREIVTKAKTVETTTETTTTSVTETSTETTETSTEPIVSSTTEESSQTTAAPTSGTTEEGSQTTAAPTSGTTEEGSQTTAAPASSTSVEGSQTTAAPASSTSVEGSQTTAAPASSTSVEGSQTTAAPTSSTSVEGSQTTAAPTSSTTEEGSQTTAAPTSSTTEEGSQTTAAPTSSTTEEGSQTTVAENTVKYEIPTVAAKPGETVEIPVKVYAGSPVNGISLNLAADETLTYDSFAAGVAYTGEPVWNAASMAYSWNSETDQTAADAVLFTVKFTVPTDAAVGVYPITFNAANCETVNANGDILTAEYVDGAVVVEGTTATIDGYTFDKEATLIGDMFWSEDPTPFDTSDLNVQITVSMKSVAVVDGKVEEVSDTETLPIGNLFALTANSASELEYTEAGEYTIGILVDETAIAEAVENLVETEVTWTDLDKSAVAGEFTVLVGLRGDVNLDGKVDVADAVQILQYSAAAILEEAGGQPEIPSAEIIEPDSLAKFCADVDCYKDAEHAKINTADAVCILNYSAAFLANGSASWYEVPGANQYVAYAQTDDE
ncbi:cohesin domain-containing protein [Ruminococcus champanellensis]|uniref:cohesin domain-containing protein n=1 Tax=Ruminococcus champanellensis TaxID=1161942 RepID=UPI0023F301C8|nr:cohesin domain-containing protein [Ruminococcus champanellensis]